MGHRPVLLLEAALNGARVHPHTPRTPEELAATARACVAAGARVLHLHPYDAAGRETLAAEPCAAALHAVEVACPGIPISLSTSAAIEPDPRRRRELVAAWTLLPELVTANQGERVGYRLALDHPARLTKLVVLDIIPTGEAFRRADRAFGLGYWHWFFLAQPYPLPEALLGANPDAYYFRDRQAPWLTPEALDDYLRYARDPETIHAMCEDYRAGATVDFRLDEADRGARRITCPVLALWGRAGKLEEWYDVLAIWRDWAEDVRGHALDCGHYLPEEAPEETYAALRTFLAA